MEKFKEYLIEKFKEELEEAMVLSGISIKDRKEEAEQNKLSGFISIEKIMPFIKKCEEIQVHILNPMLENLDAVEMDKKIEESLPSILRPSVKILRDEIKKEQEERVANFKEFEELDEQTQNEIIERLVRYYETDLDRFYKEPALLAGRYKIKMSKEKIMELVNKKILGDLGEPTLEIPK